MIIRRFHPNDQQSNNNSNNNDDKTMQIEPFMKLLFFSLPLNARLSLNSVGFVFWLVFFISSEFCC